MLVSLSPKKNYMKVAAYQAPLLAAGSMDAISLIRKRVKWCESAGVTILCCPEAILGGLVDDAPDSYGSSEIVNPDGMVVQSPRELSEDLIVAEIDVMRQSLR